MVFSFCGLSLKKKCVIICRMLVSTAAMSLLNANTRIARAVYFPTPGNFNSSFSVPGILPNTAAFLRYNALRLYPIPFQSLRTSAVDARAKSATEGYRLINSAYFGMTRSTCVCWSITSETRMLYGSCVCRHGRSRRCIFHQVNIMFRNFRISFFSIPRLIIVQYKHEIRCCCINRPAECRQIHTPEYSFGTQGVNNQSQTANDAV